MAQFERERTMPASPRVVFDLVSDTNSMQAWLPDGLEVQFLGPGRVLGRMMAAETTREREGYLDVKRDELRLEWGDLHGEGYSGSLEVSEDPHPGRSRVTLRLAFLGPQPVNLGGETYERTELYMMQALDRIEALVADRVSP